MDLDVIIKSTTYRLLDDHFIILKTKKLIEDPFAIVKDEDSWCIVVEQWKGSHALQAKDIEGMDRDWRVITFETELAFDVVGFIARVASKLAEKDIPIFVLSTYTTDHLLIKHSHLEDTRKALEELGFKASN